MTLDLFKKSRSVRYSWVMSYVFILLVAVISEGIVYFFNMEIIRNEINSSNELVISQMKNKVDDMIDGIERFSIAVASNQDVLNASITGVDDNEISYRTFKVSQNLKNYIIFDTYIKKYYVYLNKLDSVVIPGAAYNKSTFFNTYLTGNGYTQEQWMEMMEEEHRGDYVFMQFHDNDATSSRVVAYVRSISANVIGNSTAAMAILLDFNELVKNNSRENGNFKQRKLFIINQDGDVITGDSDANRLKGIDYDLLKGEEGTVSQDINGEKAVLSYTKSRINGWKYITVTPEAVYWEKLTFTRNIMFAGLFFCIFFGTIISYFFIRRNYNPLKDVVAFFRNRLHLEADAEMNEYGFLQKTFSETLEQKATISSKLEQQNVALKANFIAAMLKGRYISSPVHELMTSYNIHFNYHNFFVLSIYIDSLDENFWNDGHGDSSSQFSMCRFVIANVLEELINRENCGYLAEVDDMQACIINTDAYGESFRDVIRHTISEAREILEKHYKMNLLLSVSGLHECVEAIPEAFGEAVSAMEYMRVMGIKDTTFHSDISSEKGSGYYYPVEKEFQLINYIKAADDKAAISIIDDIFNKNFGNGSPSLEITRCIIFDLASTMIKASNEVVKQEDKAYIDQWVPVGEIMKCKNYMEIKNKLHITVKDICSYISSGKEQNEYKLKDAIIQIITEQYNNPNLGIANIAEQMEKHPNYISKVFKEQMGEGILDYMNRIRIRKAKELIMENTFNQEEIAEKVGYTNVRTFQRAFKRQEGITPGKLRNG